MTGNTDWFGEAMYDRAADRVLDSFVSGQPFTLEPLNRGNRKQTAIVRFDHRGPVVLQLCAEQTWLRTESALLREIRERTAVPVPPVLSAGVTDEVAFMITAYVPGDDLHEQFTRLDRESQRELSESFGAYLGTLHDEFQFTGYGALTVDDGHLVGRSTDWGTWLEQYGRTAIERLPAEFDAIRETLRTLCAREPPGGRPVATLFPWDFRPGNALIAGETVTTILDWEVPLAATPALSVAKAEYLVANWYAENPNALQEAFVTGYEEVRPYPAVRPVHRAAAIADSAVDSSGAVTNPGYPELDREAAVAFHREALVDLL